MIIDPLEIQHSHGTSWNIVVNGGCTAGFFVRFVLRRLSEVDRLRHRQKAGRGEDTNIHHVSGLPMGTDWA